MATLKTLVTAIAAPLFLAACASGAKVENMTYDGEAMIYPEAIRQNISVEQAVGGEETNPLWTSEISDEAFTQALTQSLESQKLLNADGPYTLKATLVSVDQPMIGINFTVTTKILYTLHEKETGKELMNELITTPFTAGIGDAFVGVKRLRLANEGSGKHNIEALLKKLKDLKISPKSIALN